MTIDTMDLQALAGKSPDADFLRDMIGFAATRLMELEVGALAGAAYGEKDSQCVVVCRLLPFRRGGADGHVQPQKLLNSVAQWAAALVHRIYVRFGICGASTLPLPQR